MELVGLLLMRITRQRLDRLRSVLGPALAAQLQSRLDSAGEFCLSAAEWAALRKGAAPVGLGDIVASVAQPIARLSDSVLGTRLAECGGCKQRQARLNAAVPDVRRPFG